MTDEDIGSGRRAVAGTASPAVGLFRLAVGLTQGVCLYLLLRLTEGVANWGETHPGTFAPLVMVALFTPPLLLAGAGKMRWLTLGMWAVIAASALGLIGWYDIARQAGAAGREPTPIAFAFSAAALFIAHHLILTADRARRPVAPYPAYFDAAWMAGVQLAASVAFTGAFALLLFLGAALFNIIGLSFLGDLLEKGWFSLPLLGLAFATAVHLTDVRESLIRGVRSIALMLLSWLLLVLTVLVGAFLIALPFTGLSGLWETGSATAILLAATGALIILINAAYQDGREDNLPPRVLQIAVRAASVLLVPLAGLVFWGLALRIGQHGLTPDRIIACACAIVGAIYAGGYAWAALRTLWRPGDWMKPLEPTNLIAAVAAVLAIVALFSPVADPARLSVADQVARLERGAVTPERFDYAFLRFHSGRVGEAALERLARSENTEIARRARAAQEADDRNAFDAGETPVVAWRIEMTPAGAVAPPDFLASPPPETGLGCTRSSDCVGRLVDLDGDGAEDFLVAQPNRIDVFVRGADGRWSIAAEYQMGARCPQDGVGPDARDLLTADTLETRSARWPNMTGAGSTYEPRNRCG